MPAPLPPRLFNHADVTLIYALRYASMMMLYQRASAIRRYFATASPILNSATIAMQRLRLTIAAMLSAMLLAKKICSLRYAVVAATIALISRHVALMLRSQRCLPLRHAMIRHAYEDAQRVTPLFFRVIFAAAPRWHVYDDGFSCLSLRCALYHMLD